MRSLIFLVTLILCAPSVFAEEKPTVIHDIVYGHKDGMALSYDVIIPAKDVQRNGATVIFVVSGGWVSNWFPAERLIKRRADRGNLIPNLLADGYHVVVLRHGSAPRYDVTEAVADVQRALKHLRSDIPKHGLDPERIGVFGFSAGGHLSLVLGTLGGEELPDWVRRSRVKSRGEGDDPSANEMVGTAPVAAVVAWFPPTDLRPIVGPNPNFPALDFDRSRVVEVSPALHADQGDAPTLLMHGTADQLVGLRESRRMYKALDEAGVETEIEIFQDAGHGFQGEDQKRSSQLAKEWFDRWLLEESQDTD